MMQFVIIGIAAGAAAALLFASVTSGVWLSIPLFYLAPLPIMIAGLGWSHWAAAAAALTGALSLGRGHGDRAGDAQCGGELLLHSLLPVLVAARDRPRRVGDLGADTAGCHPHLNGGT